MNTPAVSVITPCYNASRHIADCIRSVREQSFRDWEHIIVDDCSVDASVAVISRHAGEDDRIRMICHDKNMRVGAARNTAMAAASGRYLAFLDADDTWLPDKLQTQLELMQRNEWVFSYTDYAVITEDNETVKPSVGIPSRIGYKDLLKSTSIGCLTVMIDSHRIDDLAMPDMRSGQDYALWYRILRNGVDAHGVDEVLARYRVVPGSVSRNKYRAARRMWTLYREYEKLGRLTSSWYFLNYAVNAVRKSL